MIRTLWRVFYAYLIKLERPLGNRCFKRARYYLGVAVDWSKRLEVHRSGNGAKMLKFAAEHGIGFEVIKLWAFSSWSIALEFERWVKRSVKDHARLLAGAWRNFRPSEKVEADPVPAAIALLEQRMANPVNLAPITVAPSASSDPQAVQRLQLQGPKYGIAVVLASA